MKFQKLFTRSSLIGVLVAAACAGDLSGGAGSTDTGGEVSTGGSGAESGMPGENIEQESARTRCETTGTIGADLRRLTAIEVQATLADIFPETADVWSGVAMGADPVGPLGFTNDSRLLLVGPQTAEEVFRTGGDIGTVLTSDGVIDLVLPCAAAADRLEMARNTRLFCSA